VVRANCRIGAGSAVRVRRPRATALCLVTALVTALAVLVGLSGASAAAGRGVRAAGHEVLTWGRNQFGQLGNDTTAHTSVPVSALLPAGTSVTQVTGGYGFSLALTSDGRIWAWGDNSSGQLGIGSFDDSLVPVLVHLPAGAVITAIAAGDDHVVALTSTGELLAWGYNQYGQVGDGTNTDRTEPVAVDLPAGVTVTAIGAGAGHSLAVTSTGRVLAWGYNNTGQLGDGTNTDSNVPVEVPLPAGDTFTAVAGGSGHSLALTSTGQMYAWGYNAYGQLGNNTTTSTNLPVQVQLPVGTTVTAIAGGHGFTSLGLTSTGQVLAWGHNNRGQLGDGTNTNSRVPISVQLPAGTTVTAIAGGDDHGLALTSAGHVLAWGYNAYGQLGNDSTTNTNVPVDVDLPDSVTVLAIGAGGYHSLAITALAPEETTTTLSASPDQQVHGRPVTLTSDVDCPAGPATGSVAFYEGSTLLGTATLTGGRATLAVRTLAVGEHTIVAHYEGDDQCLPSASSPVTVTITKATSATTLTATSTRQIHGRPVTLTAHATCPGGTATGTVTFFNGTHRLGTATLHSGRAVLTTRSLTVGRHTITAHYNGNAECDPSTSAAAAITITVAPRHHVPVTG
jgi:alpha-tubulin suppressor-like RCC1 family protein